MTAVPVAIALGSNLGDRDANLQRAVELLAAGPLTHVRVAAPVTSAPLDCPPGAPGYRNTALVGETTLACPDLLLACRAIEEQLGRPAQRAYHASRTIDIDILLYGDRQFATPTLTVPHSHLTERDFVLDPLAELAPDWRVPGTDATVAEWRSRLRR